jgi:hypothetical protein
MRAWWRVATPALIGAALSLVSCAGGSGTPSEPEFEEAELRVMFIGNSLTYAHDVPGLVRALAEADGRSMSQLVLAMPDASLEDHWHAGAADYIRRLQPDVVVMQQGPSSLPESRVHLVHWTRTFDAVIREVGAKPALYMVWPPTTRSFAFDDVMGSYAAAADAVDGLLLPAGATWVEAWALDPSLPFYSGDGFHPSYLGALAAAQTIYAVLFDADPMALPRIDDTISDADLDTLRRAVAASIAAWDAGS